MKRRTTAILAAAALVVGGTAGGALLNQRADAAEARCDTTTAYLHERGDPKPTGSGPKSVYIIGDSYTSGDVLKDRAQAWPNNLPDEWAITADGIGSTGFTNPGNCPGNLFSNRTLDALKDKSATVIIQGGLNDWKASSDELSAAAYNTLLKLEDAPTVYVIGPVNAPARSSSAEKVDEALRHATEASGRTYISMLDLELPYLPDELHLTPEGHEQFAERVAEAIGE